MFVFIKFLSIDSTVSQAFRQYKFFCRAENNLLKAWKFFRYKIDFPLNLDGGIALDARLPKNYYSYKNGKVCWFGQRAKVGDKLFRLFCSPDADDADAVFKL
jgi:hypothetical protein